MAGEKCSRERDGVLSGRQKICGAIWNSRQLYVMASDGVSAMSRKTPNEVTTTYNVCVR